MDIFSHAFAGAASGFAFGRPILGAIVAVMPDLVLGLRRKPRPTNFYDFTHSILFCFLVAAVGLLFETIVPLLSVLSHLLLDIPTHGKQWGPRLLFPFGVRFGLANEWEFFSKTWWIGLLITFIWSVLWVLPSALHIGFQ